MKKKDYDIRPKLINIMEPEKNKKIFKDKIIQLSHGDGGIKTSELISNLILKYFGNKTLNKLMDSAVIKGSSQKIAFTTDSFVVNPIFFPGGDIGKLAVCGTINDLVTSGCTPSGLSLSFILEEGFAVKDLIKILSSMKKVLKESGAVIVTGDTKVVERGIADKIYINTSGIGFIPDKLDISPCRIKEGDAILLNGDIGEHGAAILGERKEFDFKSDIKSDCAPLSSLVSDIISVSSNIHALRDATRGGLASILFELSEASNTTFEIHEEKIPVKKEVRGICEFLGLDPLYMTNEGKMAVFVDKKDAEAVLNKMKKNKYGKNSRIIGRVSGKNKDKSGRVFLITELGTRRILDLQYSEQLPRIC